MSKIILYGDSNTYGYDPRGFMGGRYPDEIRWTSAITHAQKDTFTIIEDGQNGRLLPEVSSSHFKQLVTNCQIQDYLVMMLGTNDILLTDNPNASLATNKLEDILLYIQKYCNGTFILMVPPYIGSDKNPNLKLYYESSVKMNKLFIALATQYNIPYINTAEWNIPMGADGVHFSVDGHKKFAACFLNSFNTFIQSIPSSTRDY